MAALRPARLRRTLPRLALLAGLIAGGLAVGTAGAAPAFADSQLTVSVDPGSIDLKAGGSSQTLNVQVSVSGDPTNVTVTISVPLTDKGVKVGQTPSGCSANRNDTVRCSLGLVSDSKTLPIELQPPDQYSGDKQNGQGNVEARGGGGSATASYSVNLSSGKKTVGGVSGKVVDQNNNPVPNATVNISDSTGHAESTSTDNTGSFSWSPNGDHQLAAGKLTIGAQASGFLNNQTQVDAKEGQNVNAGTIQLSSSAPPSTSPTPSPTVARSSAAPPPTDSGLGLGTWLLIILGALLVIGGIVAIVLLLRGRKGKDDDDNGGPPYFPHDDDPHGYGQSPHGYGDAGATSVLNPVSADAPTMMQRPVQHQPDEYDDYDNFASSYGTGGYAPGGAGRGYDEPTRQVPRDRFDEATRHRAQRWDDEDDEPTPPHGAGRHSAPDDNGDRYNHPTTVWDPNDRRSEDGPAERPRPTRHGLDDATRQWNPNQPPSRSHRAPEHDETRLDRQDGVDWLDG